MDKIDTNEVINLITIADLIWYWVDTQMSSKQWCFFYNIWQYVMYYFPHK